MPSFKCLHLRRLWAEALLHSGYSHDTALKTWDYENGAKDVEESGKRAAILLNTLKNSKTEEEFVKRLEALE